MNSFVKKGAYMLFVASLAVGLVACGDDDPDFNHVTPPTVAVATSQISGLVSTMSGEALSGATINATAGSQKLTATTQADGSYVLAGAQKGTYVVEVSAAGKLTAKGEVIISKDGESAVFNAALANAGQEVKVSDTEDTKAVIVTETIKGNEQAAVETTIVIPAGAAEDEMVITPVYNEAMAITRATENTMIVGMNVASKKSDVKLKKAVSLIFDVTAEVAQVAAVKKFANGTWSSVAAKNEGGKMVVEADEFGTYGIFLPIIFSTKTAAEKISFSQDKFDNLYGAKDMFVKSATYTYKQGAEVSVVANSVLAAHLRQVLFVKVSASNVQKVEGVYDLNVTLPVGTALNLAGTQQVTTLSATIGNVSNSVTTYGSVIVSASTYNRDHVGGSN